MVSYSMMSHWCAHKKARSSLFITAISVLFPQRDKSRENLLTKKSSREGEEREKGGGEEASM